MYGVAEFGLITTQLRRDTSLVDDLHQKGPPTILQQFLGHRAFHGRDAALGIDRHLRQHQRIEHRLDRDHGRPAIGILDRGFERRLLFSGER
ncbi:MAG TPA: hypothetical protein VM510_17335 [Caulifigura sp.]|nr:hypothetical protein [Caulifigura sp.]